MPPKTNALARTMLVCVVCERMLVNAVMGIKSHLNCHVRRGELDANKRYDAYDRITGRTKPNPKHV